MSGSRQGRAILQAETIPLAVYVHLPWCIRKCPYCDFNSHATEHASFPERSYIAALVRDLDHELPNVQDRMIQSIFIGGGTPSLFSAASLDHLLSEMQARLAFAADIEITLEANPGTFEVDRFRQYRSIGINRLSIGIQSFNDRMLSRLGRIHDAAAAARAIGTAREAGFERINLDLMYGLPEQTLAQAEDDLAEAISHKPSHLSWYQLTIEPNTVFFKRPPPTPEHDQLWEIQQSGQRMLAAAGLGQYEISAYATEYERCRHNLNYWLFGDYLGIGAGAHGKLTHAADSGIYRYARHRLPDRYMALAGRAEVIAETKQLQSSDLVLEFMMNALRLTGGFEHSVFEQRTGLPFSSLSSMIEQAYHRGWLETADGTTRPTVAGLNYLNDLLQLFMPES